MSDSRKEWLAIIGSPLIGLGLLCLLRAFLPPGMALGIAVTSAIAWGYYWKTGEAGLVVVPITIAFAFAVARLVPYEWRPVIAIACAVAGMLVGARFRQRRLHPAD